MNKHNIVDEISSNLLITRKRGYKTCLFARVCGYESALSCWQKNSGVYLWRLQTWCVLRFGLKVHFACKWSDKFTSTLDHFRCNAIEVNYGFQVHQVRNLICNQRSGIRHTTFAIIVLSPAQSSNREFLYLFDRANESWRNLRIENSFIFLIKRTNHERWVAHLAQKILR